MSRGSSKRPSKEGVTATLRLDDAQPFQQEVARKVRAHFLPVLVVMSGDHMGTRVTVEGNVLVGRDPAAGLCLGDAGVSWHHAHIEDRGGSWAVVDEGSTNGTAVNGERISDQELKNGDKIVFGRTLARFEMQDAADQAYDEFVAKLLNVDDLSGLYLRRRFDSELRAMLASAASDDEPVGLLVMDLDGIKKINDTHGHAFGAYTIGEAGHVIGRITQGRGIACRWGGDEFLAALKSCDLKATMAVGEEIHDAIASHTFEHEGVELSPGISIGAAAFPAQAKSAKALFRAADGAMYRAKKAGKNRVSD